MVQEARSRILRHGRHQPSLCERSDARIAADALVWIASAVLAAVSGSYVFDKALTRKKTNDSNPENP